MCNSGLLFLTNVNSRAMPFIPVTYNVGVILFS